MTVISWYLPLKMCSSTLGSTMEWNSFSIVFPDVSKSTLKTTDTKEKLDYTSEQFLFKSPFLAFPVSFDASIPALFLFESHYWFHKEITEPPLCPTPVPVQA